MKKQNFPVGVWIGWTVFLYFMGIPVWYVLEFAIGLWVALIIPVIAAVLALKWNKYNPPRKLRHTT
jgi:hypothetical protein